MSASAAELSGIAMSPGLSPGTFMYLDFPDAADRVELPLLVLGLWTDLIEHSEPPNQETPMIPSTLLSLAGTALSLTAIPATTNNEADARHPQTQLAFRNAGGASVSVFLKAQATLRPGGGGHLPTVIPDIEITVAAGATVITAPIPAAYKNANNRVVFDVDTTTNMTAASLRPD